MEEEVQQTILEQVAPENKGQINHLENRMFNVVFTKHAHVNDPSTATTTTTRNMYSIIYQKFSAVRFRISRAYWRHIFSLLEAAYYEEAGKTTTTYSAIRIQLLLPITIIRTSDGPSTIRMTVFIKYMTYIQPFLNSG